MVLKLMWHCNYNNYGRLGLLLGLELIPFLVSTNIKCIHVYVHGFMQTVINLYTSKIKDCVRLNSFC